MKVIIAIIKPDRLQAVKEELYKAEVNLVTVSEVLGQGRNLLRKVQLMIAVNDDFVERTIKAIIKGGKTGEIGDVKIFVLPLDECIRIRTEERGDPAIG